jgi:hypothetical protein
VVVAGRAGDPGLLHSVQAAFTHGMDLSLLVSGVIAVIGVVLTLIFLPARPPRRSMDVEVPVSPLVTAESVV